MQKLINEIKWVITLGGLIVLIIGGFIGYAYAKDHNPTEKKYQDDFDKFREVYHNDYITTIKLFIQDCSELSNNSLVIVRHLVDIQNKHLGLIYKCSSSIPNNLTLAVQYSKLFFEVG